jgi:predicted AAA+ superfamily ATPase
MNGRWLAGPLAAAIRRPYVHVLFGARQAGKSTLLRSLVTNAALWIDLSEPAQRSAYLARPERFVQECRALPRARSPLLIVVDEVQAVPALLDAVQHLYDQDKKRFHFVLSGSSARKLRVAGANLLPGRAMFHRIHPLILAERPGKTSNTAPINRKPIFPLRGEPSGGPPFPETDLVERLAYGELPGISLAPVRDRAGLLGAYALVYLEEEKPRR